MRCLRLDCMAARRVRAVLAIGNDARTREETGNIRSLRCGAIEMGRRRGEDSIASRKRRLPYVAKIKRDDPFRPFKPAGLDSACPEGVRGRRWGYGAELFSAWALVQ